MTVFAPGEVISYLDMCRMEKASLQRGMNYELSGAVSVILMSRRPNAPYNDVIEERGKVLIYEGHDQPRNRDAPDPKTVDQSYASPSGAPTQNGLFFEAARRAKAGHQPERVRVYEKIRTGIWVFNGVFDLVDAWKERVEGRSVFKFKLVIVDDAMAHDVVAPELEHTRLIPSAIKMEVWKRDKGCCVRCGATDHLHFDHLLPYSKGGSSLLAENIQLLCARHNLEKRDRIE